MMNYKKIITRISFLMALLLGHAGMAWAAHSVSISDLTIKAGEEATLEVNFTSDASDIYYVNGTIALPEGLEVVVTDEGYADVTTTDRTVGFACNMNVSTGLFRVTSLTKNAITGNSGAIATIKVKASADITAGEKNITLANFTVKHTDGTEEGANTTNATVTIEEQAASQIAFSPKELNLKAGESASIEVVNNGDDLYGFTATLEASSDELELAATGARLRSSGKIDRVTNTKGTLFTIQVTASSDFNGDATLLLSDISAFSDEDEEVEVTFDDLMLTISAGEAAPEVEEASFAFDYSGDLNLVAGETVEVPVLLTNGCTLAGFQAKLALPTGLTAEIVKSDRTAAAPNYSETTGNINCLGGITGKDGVLFTLRLTADETLEDGTLTLSNLKVTTPSAKSIAADPAEISLNVVKGTDNVVFAFSKEEIELKAGEKATVDVTMTNDRARSGFQATLTLPEGITATLEKSDRLFDAPTYLETTGNITYLGGIKDNDGVLFTITLTASEDFKAGGELTLTKIKTTTASAKSSKADDIALTIKLQEDVYTLDETSEEPLVAGEYAKVVLKRVFRQGWNTVCLPFEVASVAEFFGAEATAYEFSGFEGGSLQFTLIDGDVVTLESGKPYVVYVPEEITEKELTDVTITAEAQTVVQGEARFVGTFAPKGEMEGKYGVTDDAHIAKGSSKASIDGFRAYFELPAGTSGARLMLCDETTGLAKVVKEAATGNDTLYNIGGLRVAQPTKAGIYIREDKKVIIK